MTSIFSTLFILLDAALPPKGYFFVRETLPWILVVAILITLQHMIKDRESAASGSSGSSSSSGQ